MFPFDDVIMRNDSWSVGLTYSGLALNSSTYVYGLMLFIRILIILISHRSNCILFKPYTPQCIDFDRNKYGTIKQYTSTYMKELIKS